MTKKQFIALADAIKEHNTWAKHNPNRCNRFTTDQIERLADFCQQQNHRFNRERWLDYIAGECGPSGGKIKGDSKR